MLHGQRERPCLRLPPPHSADADRCGGVLQNGQGWPKFALRSVFTTADGGVAVSLFNPIRAELGAGAVLVVDTDFPFEDEVRVLLAGLSKPTPLQIRVPGWAPHAVAFHNGRLIDLAGRNGTMYRVSCAAGSLCNLTLALRPQLRLERWYGDSVSVLRGPLLFSLHLGHRIITYPTMAPMQLDGRWPPASMPPRGPQPVPPSAGWFGVEPTSPPNMSLVIKDTANLSSSFELVRRGLRCHVKPTAASWPACALSTPRTCERTCVAAFNRSSFPLFLRGKGRAVHDWPMRTMLEAAPPPRSPACAEGNGMRCGEEVDIELVPHGQTNVRVGSFPLA